MRTETELKGVVENAGGVFVGIQRTDSGDYVLFQSHAGASTLALSANAVTVNSVRFRIARSREKSTMSVANCGD